MTNIFIYIKISMICLDKFKNNTYEELWEYTEPIYVWKCMKMNFH